MRLTANVIVRRPSDSELVVLVAGEDLPGWATDMVTNPAVLAGDPPAAENEGTPTTADDGAEQEPAANEGVLDPEDPDPTAQADEEPPATAEDTPADDAPSGEWTLRRLREYAQAHDVDLGEARTKKDVLDVLTQ